jgi:tubulin polyglutamylase TTLL6/13
MCFQILGFDVMLDYKLNPYLLEINQMPSFATDAPLDYNIKKNLIIDTIKLLCLSMDRKRQYKAERKAKIQESILKPTRAMMVEKI